MSILNIAVSYFDTVYESTPTGFVNLKEWITTDLYRKEVEQLRQLKNKDEIRIAKLKLPAITASGVFEKQRNERGLSQHSGFICIDIDNNDSLNFDKLTSLKFVISTIPEVAYCGFSVSGRGLYALIPIANPQKHKLYFQALKQYFLEELDVTIDKACGDITRLRLMSYDDDYYINENATQFSTLPKRENKVPTIRGSYAKDTHLNYMIEYITEHEIDITADREDWLAICSVLVNTYGEGGREYFHSISQYYPEYDAKECDALYDDLLKRPPYNKNFGTLVYLFRQQAK